MYRRRRGLGALSVTDLINQDAAKYGIDPALLLAIARQESNLNPAAVSSAGAQGVMQLMPATAASLGVTNPFDPAQNIDAGARYFSQLLSQFGGDTSLALAAYNAGPGSVSKYGGIPPFAETQNYVSSILSSWGGNSASDSSGNLPGIDLFGSGDSSVAGLSTGAVAGLGIAAAVLLLLAVS